MSTTTTLTDTSTTTGTTEGTMDGTTTESTLGSDTTTQAGDTTTRADGTAIVTNSTAGKTTTTTKKTTATNKPVKYTTSVASVAPKDDPVLKNLEYIVTVEPGRDVRVLQLSDTQIIEEQLADSRCYTYIRKAVETVKPDFIFITGDMVYGKHDPDGEALRSLIRTMDSFGIPWTGVFGNHDNESQMGAIWQCQQLENSQYGLFNSNDNVTGNSNLSVGIVQGGELVRVFYMLDSNYCGAAFNPKENGVANSTKGFTKEQLVWIQMKMQRIQKALGGKNMPGSLAYHIPTMEFVYANNQYTEKAVGFTLHLDLEAKSGDFGSIRESGGIKTPVTAPDAKGMTFLELLKEYTVDSVFCGHSHLCNTSVMWEGIRWTFGLKTGTFDRFTEKELGGTQITFNKTSFSVRHVYHDSAYDEYMNTLEQFGPFA